jgi:hypothetical protein
MRHRAIKGLALAAGVFLLTMTLAASANAGSLFQGAAGQTGSVTGSVPGEVLWGYYQTADSEFGAGDSILRLINPNGAANTNLAGAKAQTVCAMIYVFDEDQEMGECCGCPITSAGLLTFSAYRNLTANWAVGVFDEEFCASNACGSIAVVAAAQNTGILGLGNGLGCTSTQSGACNGGCDPTNTPGYSVTTANNLLGSITHNQVGFLSPFTDEPPNIFGITEVSLSDDAGGDPTNLIYLQNQCGALVGNGTGGGICNCPSEVPAATLQPASF